jgi:peroxiredoxin
MKNILFALMAVLFLASPAHAAVKVGEAAPDFTATDSNGKTVKLSDYKGKIVVLEWTSNECPFVQKFYQAGDMPKFQKAAAEKGVVWLSVDSSAEGKPGFLDGAAANKWYFEEKGAAPAAFLIDKTGEIGRAYDAQTTPHMFVIDKEGKVAYAGAIDSKPSVDQADIAGATNYVMLAIDDLNAGRLVSIAPTKSYGCSIKY